MVSGVVSALAGIFWTLRYASARADNGTGLELPVVAAVLLGGVSIFGGRGTLAGVLAGVLLLGTVRNALQLADVSDRHPDHGHRRLLILSVVGPNAVALHQSPTCAGEGASRQKGIAMIRTSRCPPPVSPLRPGRRRLRRHHPRRRAPDSGAAPQASGQADPNAPLKTGLKISFLPKQVNNPYFTVSDNGGKAAVAEFKGEYKEVGPSEASASSQVSYINTLSQQQTDVIVISANDPNAICGALQQARTARRQGGHLRLGHQPGLPGRVRQPGHRRRASRRTR